MKVAILLITISNVSFAQSNSNCNSIWEIPKGWQLQKSFESKTLCAFNIKSKDHGSTQWIVSKKKNTDVYNGKLEELGLEDSCLHSHPQNDTMSCPDDTGKDYFKIIATAKKETVSEIKK